MRGVRKTHPVRHGESDELADARARLAGAEEHEGLLRQALPLEAQGGHDAGQGDAGRPLDVVVEAALHAPVLPQEVKRVVVREVLELQDAVRHDLPHRPHELVQEGRVLRAGGPPLPEPLVLGVPQQALVVRAHVQAHREALVGVHARRRGVEENLPLRDPHAAGPEVPEAQDAFAVGDDAHLDPARVRPVAQLGQDPPFVPEADEQPGGPQGQVAVPLAGLPHRGRVDVRQHLLRVRAQQAEERGGVRLLEVPQVEVLIYGRLQPPQALHGGVPPLPPARAPAFFPEPPSRRGRRRGPPLTGRKFLACRLSAAGRHRAWGRAPRGNRAPDLPPRGAGGRTGTGTGTGTPARGSGPALPGRFFPTRFVSEARALTSSGRPRRAPRRAPPRPRTC